MIHIKKLKYKWAIQDNTKGVVYSWKVNWGTVGKVTKHEHHAM